MSESAHILIKFHNDVHLCSDACATHFSMTIITTFSYNYYDIYVLQDEAAATLSIETAMNIEWSKK